MVLLHQGIAVGGFDAPQRQQRAALDAEILFDPRKQRFILPQRFLAGDDAPVRDAAIDVLPDLLVEFRLLLHLLEHGHVRLDVAHHAVYRSRPKRLSPAHAHESRRAIGRSQAASRQTPRREDASRAPAPRPDRSSARRVGVAENQAVSSAHSSGAGRSRQAKVTAPPQLAILLQVCGNFGQPAPDRRLRLRGEPGLQPAFQGSAARPAFAEQRLSAPGQRPLQHPAVHRVRRFSGWRRRVPDCG